MKNNSIIKGNVYKDRNEKQWLIGSFMDKSAGLRRDKRVEVKWGVHKKGEKRIDWAKSRSGTTLGILIKGKFRFLFSTGEKYLLSKEGDYILWSSKISHSWEVVENCVFLTVRWPSTPENIINKKYAKHS